MYSDTINDRLPARASAALSVWPRHHQKSATRKTAKVSSAAAVSVAMATLDTGPGHAGASLVIRERPVTARITAAGGGLEHMARRHLAAIDVQRDRRLIEGVRQHVIL